MEDRRTRYDTDLAVRRRVTQRFLAASSGGDVASMLEVLAPGVTLVSDGGGLAPAPRKAIQGADLVAHAFAAFARRLPEQLGIELVEVNGGPGIVAYSAGIPVTVLVLHLVDGAVDTIHLIANPEKLTGVRTA